MKAAEPGWKVFVDRTVPELNDYQPRIVDDKKKPKDAPGWGPWDHCWWPWRLMTLS
jgi:hypothetical protein